MAKNNASVSVSRAAASRINRLEHNSLVQDSHANELTIASKGYQSRTRVRHPSIIAGNAEPEGNSI